MKKKVSLENLNGSISFSVFINNEEHVFVQTEFAHRLQVSSNGKNVDSSQIDLGLCCYRDLGVRILNILCVMDVVVMGCFCPYPVWTPGR